MNVVVETVLLYGVLPLRRLPLRRPLFRNTPISKARLLTGVKFRWVLSWMLTSRVELGIG